MIGVMQQTCSPEMQTTSATVSDNVFWWVLSQCCDHGNNAAQEQDRESKMLCSPHFLTSL